ncbi:MAG: DUF937 domain-containing protein [Saprospiraceae bacterium]
MLDNILGGLKDQVISAVAEKTGLNANQAGETIPVAKESIMSGLMGAVSGGNMSGILGMFSGGKGGFLQNMVYQNIAGNFVSGITSKLGISSDMAQMVSATALPMIMEKIGGKAADDSGNVTESGLMSALGMSGGGMGDMLGKAGDMLGGGGDAAEGLKDKAEDLLKGGIGGLFGK